MAAALVVLFSNLLNIIIPFKFIGEMVVSMYRMLTGDILRFLCVYIVLLYGFASAMYVLVHENYVESEGLSLSPSEVRFRVSVCFMLYM
jgi:hypothetical protein